MLNAHKFNKQKPQSLMGIEKKDGRERDRRMNDNG